MSSATHHEPVPSEVTELLQKLDGFHLPIRLGATADLSLSGDPCVHMVILSADRLAVVAVETRCRLIRVAAFEGVDGFRVLFAIGSGFLQAFIDGAWVDLARFSNSRGPRFRELAEALESLRNPGGEDVRRENLRQAAPCPECGVKLPPGHLSCPRCRPRRVIAARLWRILKPQRSKILAVCGLTLAGVALELVPPKLQQYLVDEILTRGTVSTAVNSSSVALLAMVLALAAGRFASGVVGWLKGTLANDVGVATTHELRAQLVRKLHALEMAYHDRHQVGALVSRVGFDTEVVHSLLQQMTSGFLMQIIQVVAVGFMLFTIHPGLALLTMIPMPLVFVGSLAFWRRIYPNNFRYYEAGSRQAGSLTDMLSGIRVVKTYGQEAREFERYGRASDHLRDCRLALERATIAYSAVMVVLFSLGGLIVWYVGGREVLKGRMTLGSLIAFLAYLAIFYAPLSTLSQLTTWLTSFLTGCQRVFDLIDTPNGAGASVGGERLPKASGAICFDNVTFGYEPRRPILKGLNFRVKSGEMIGIVGRSGSGKTTIANLISRLYDVGSGRVLLDGLDVRDLDGSDLRRAVGVVLQEPFLFRATIADNLAFGRPDSGPERTVAAAHAVCAHDFILKKPLGYDTWLGERGAGLSGGEKQRLCLARVLLCDPSVLILDESTSSVDPETEEEVRQALRILARGRTTIAISHHLNTIRHADRIFVLDEGRLVEEGRHDELVERKGHYARLATIQNQCHRNQPADWTADVSPVWLDPCSVRVGECSRSTLEVVTADGSAYRGVYAIRCFPATRPDAMISLRTSDRDGRDREIGVIRRLDDWSVRSRELIEVSLRNRYHMRRITAVENVKVEYGNLIFSVKTDRGAVRFVMRWNENHVQDFGDRGKLITDLQDDCFLIPDLDALPTRDRELFQRYVYW